MKGGGYKQKLDEFFKLQIFFYVPKFPAIPEMAYKAIYSYKSKK